MDGGREDGGREWGGRESYELSSGLPPAGTYRSSISSSIRDHHYCSGSPTLSSMQHHKRTTLATAMSTKPTLNHLAVQRGPNMMS